MESEESGLLLDRTGCLVEKSRVSVTRKDVGFEEGSGVVAVAVGDLALPLTRLVVLASLIALQRLAMNVIEFGLQARTIRVFVGSTARAAIGFALEDFRDSRLRDTKFMRNVSLRHSGSHELPRPLGTGVHHLTWLMTVFAATSVAWAVPPHGVDEGSTCRAVLPL